MKILKKIISIMLIATISLMFLGLDSTKKNIPTRANQLNLTAEEKDIIKKHQTEGIDIGVVDFLDYKDLSDVFKNTFGDFFNIKCNLKEYKRFGDAYGDLKNKKIDYIVTNYKHKNDLKKSEAIYDEDFFIAYTKGENKDYTGEKLDSSFFRNKLTYIKKGSQLTSVISGDDNKGKVVEYDDLNEAINNVKNSNDNTIMLINAQKVPRVIEKGLEVENVLPTYKSPTMVIESLDENKEFINVINKYFLEGGREYLNSKLRNVIYMKIKDTFVSNSLTAEEKKFINNNKEITVNIMNADYPILFKQNGRLTGLAYDYLEEFSKITGLKMNYKYVEKNNSMYTLPPINENEIYLDFSAIDKINSSNYKLDADIFIIGKHGSVKDVENSDVKLGLLKNSSGNIYFKNIGKEGLIEYETNDELLKAYDRDEIDLIAVNEYVYYNQFSAKNHDLNIVDKIGANTSVSLFSFKKNGHLDSIFNKGCKSIINTMKINSKWKDDVEKLIGDTVYNYNKKEKKTAVLKASFISFGIGISIITGILIVGIIIYRNKNKDLLIKDVEINEALKKAKAADNAKSRFLANISHEIRTPINAIMGMSRIGIEESSGKAREQFDVILTSSKYLLSLINDILDMSKIESGKLELVNEEFNLKKVIDETKFIISQRINEKNQHLIINFDDSLEKQYIGDSIRLSQVILNLLSNASKFTPSGNTITFNIKEINNINKESTIEFSVIDTGIGIPNDKIEKLFNPFYQISNNMYKSQLGTGLGLPISKKIIELMNGSINVTSQENEGSVFTFRIYISEADVEEAVIEKKEADISSLNILLVDDVDINRMIILELLGPKVGNIDIAENGQEAVDIFSKSNIGYYDVILMDVQMPVLNGNDATKKIRSLERIDAKKVRIIAMSANAFEEDRVASMKSGMNDYVTKPINIEKLVERLEY